MIAENPEETRQIEPELLQRLGLVVVRWALIENWISDLFVKMTEANPGSMIVVTSNVSQSTITGWIRTLLDTSQTPPDDAEELREVLNEVDELRTERNALIHGLWFTTGPADSAIVQTVKLDRSAVIKDEVVTAADLDDLIYRIVEVATHLREILIAFRAYP